MMVNFLEKVENLTDIADLISLKEQLKDEIMAPTLSWEERIVLYRQVRIINEKIASLRV